MGGSQPKMCHTQEIAFEPAHDEWRPIDEWHEDLSQGQSCEPRQNCRLCCKPVESHVEEVLVVHHEALQKVDFLLRHDELTSCEAPAVPECVTAVQRARVVKRLWLQQGTSQAPHGTREDTGGSRRELSAVPAERSGGQNNGAERAPQPLQEESEGGDPSDDESTRQLLPEFSSEGAPLPLAGLEERFRIGLDMWTLSRGQDHEVVQETVLLQMPEWDSSVIRINGDRFHKTFPLHSITCVELTTNVKSGRCNGVPEERGVYVYLTATTGSQGTNDCAHFAFQHAKDAHDFRTWMRTFHPSQLVSASDADPVGTC